MRDKPGNVKDCYEVRQHRRAPNLEGEGAKGGKGGGEGLAADGGL